MTDVHSISAGIAGTVLPPVCRTLTARETMSFAAGLGAKRASYYDTPAPAVPPAACVMLEWDVLNGAPYRDLLGATQGQMERAIHVSQYSRFLKPIPTGDALATLGTIVGVRQKRSGVLVGVDLTTSCYGETLGSSRFVSLFSGAQLAGEDVWDIPAIAAGGEPDVEWRPLPVDALTAQIYTACSGIWNPIHTESDRARLAGLEQPIAHGTWSWGRLLEIVIDEIDRVPTSWDARFLAPVYPGTDAMVALDVNEATVRAWLKQDNKLCVVAAGTIAEGTDAG